MHNELLHIGPFTIYGYGLMIAIGILAAYFVGERLAKKRGISSDSIFTLVILAVVCGFAGSKILYFITILPQIIEDVSVMKNLSSGWVVYGGIIGGIGGIAICGKIYKVSFFDYLDIAAPACALAQGFGRIGCLLAGCCYGAETSSAFSIVFTHSDYAPNNIALIPTQPLMSILDFMHFVFLIFVFRKTNKRGLVTGLYLFLYSIGRFVMEFFRGDLSRGHVGMLSTSQFIGLFLGLAGLLIVIWTMRKGKEETA